MIKQAAVIGLSLIPFALSTVLAFLTWEALNGIEAWRLVSTGLAWVVAFALGTRIFWRGVERLAPSRSA